jgi:hypothetical protein
MAKPGELRDPKNMKMGVHYCTLCSFKDKSSKKMKDHLVKKHKMDSRIPKKSGWNR